ncbi:3-keto-5-aminohexanoate cleavage protein [Cribrihabitans neustonicus]|uniref:3-keto-5-aminohexanoate cleavage protein n=1 Tax=Cribrihabitans neustonicus TaxID=1429085 RepID=UPI003B5A47A3
MAEYSLMVAPNGARRGRQDHEALPVTAAETAEVAAACYAAGARALHLHVRDGGGRHSLDPARYREAMAAVQERAPGMAVQITTESAGIYDVDAQLACLKALRPAAASIAVREIARDEELAPKVYQLCAEAGTRVQHILYGPECIAQLRAWYRDGTVPADRREAIFVLGKYSPAVEARPGDLDLVLKFAAGMHLNWTACAFGRQEHACLLAAVAAGGDVRIGFENNIETPVGGLLDGNAASVAAFVKAAREAGHTLKEGQS